MAQTWHDLLFAHWPVKHEILRPLVPAALPLDTYDGQCWVGIAPFHMSAIRGRGLPPLPGLSRFPELNIRTYVTLENKRGVYFFSLDARNSPAVWAARKFYHLPYFRALMTANLDGEQVNYESRRLEVPAAEFRATYRPVGAVQLHSAGTLENWLTERYCLYTVFSGRVYRAEIHHQQWRLRQAEAEIQLNTMASAAHIPLPDLDPLLHFSKRLEVLVWPLRKMTLL